MNRVFGNSIIIKKVIRYLFVMICTISIVDYGTFSVVAALAPSDFNSYEIGEKINGVTPWYEDADYYRFQVDSESHISFWVNCEYNNGKSLAFNQDIPCVIYTIYNDEGKEIANSGKFKFTNNKITGYSTGRYSKNLSAGIYYLEVRSHLADYRYSFKINAEKIIKLKKGKIESIKGLKNGINITCKNDMNALGHKIQYSTDYKFKKEVKSIKITSDKAKIRKVKSKKNYFVRICSFAVYEDGEEIYGGYSSIKKVKVK